MFLFEKYIYTVFYHWKWPVQGTSTVTLVSAHFRYLLLKISRQNIILAKKENLEWIHARKVGGG